VGLAEVPLSHSKEAPPEATGQREDLVRRVASSTTFEKSPRLQLSSSTCAGCALDNKPEAATEQQVGICVYDRPPATTQMKTYRPLAGRLLRLKLEHHFANEGKGESVVITIPKGRYLPVFETRSKRRQHRLVHPHLCRASRAVCYRSLLESRFVRTRNRLARLPA